MKSYPGSVTVKRVFQCPMSYQVTWDRRERCGKQEKHQGRCGPAEKPALAQEHSATSKDAARLIEPTRGTLRERVLEVIRGNAVLGGLTDEEGMEITGLPPSTYRPRRVELVEANLIVDSGRTRRTKSGRQAVVWVAR